MRRATDVAAGEGGADAEDDRAARAVLSRLEDGRRLAADVSPYALDDAHEMDVREMARLLEREEPVPLERVERDADRGLFDGRVKVPRSAAPGSLQIVSLGGEEDPKDDIQRQYPVDVEAEMPEEMRGYRWLEAVVACEDPLLLARALDPQLCEALEASAARQEVDRALRAALLRARARSQQDWTRLVVEAGGRFYGVRSRDAERERRRAAGERAAEGDERREAAEPIELVFYLGKSAFAHLALEAEAAPGADGRRRYAAHYYAPSRLRLQARAAVDAKRRAEGVIDRAA